MEWELFHKCPVNKVHATEVYKVTINNMAHLIDHSCGGHPVGQPWRKKVVHVERENVEAWVEVLVHAEVVLLDFEAGVQRALPPAMCLVTLELVPEVSILAVSLVVPPVLGGSSLVCGGGVGSLGFLVLVFGRDHREAVLHEELVVLCYPEIVEPDGSNPYNELKQLITMYQVLHMAPM